MVDDQLNEGSEGEKKSNPSDEDFGLPDLEFEELQELDVNFDDEGGESDEIPLPEPEGVDVSVLDDIEITGLAEFPTGLQPGDLDPPRTSVLDEGIEEVEDVLDSAQLISDRLGDDDKNDTLSSDYNDGINYDDLIGGVDTESSRSSVLGDLEDLGLDLYTEKSSDSDDLLANIDSPDQLAALGILDEDESGDDSSNMPSASSDLSESLFSADSMTEETEFIFADNVSMNASENAPFESSDTPTLPPNYKPYSDEESSGGFAKVILIGVLLIFILGGTFYYLSLDDGDKRRIAKKEVVKKKAVKKPVIEKPKVTAENEIAKPVIEKPKITAGNKITKPEVAETKKTAVVKKKPTVKPKATVVVAASGEIIRVVERTSRSYVIIGSFIDNDLATSYAQKLSNEGSGIKIIHPYGKSKRYRISVADYDSYGDAASQLSAHRSQYGDQVWALKY